MSSASGTRKVPQLYLHVYWGSGRGPALLPATARHFGKRLSHHELLAPQQRTDVRVSSAWCTEPRPSFLPLTLSHRASVAAGIRNPYTSRY